MAGALGVSALLHLGLIAALAPAPWPGGRAWAAATLEVRLQPDALVGATPPSTAAQPPAVLAERRLTPGIELPVSERYFQSSELDRRAVPLSEPPLLYPESAWINRLPGRVVVRLFISEQGAVDSAVVLEAAPAGRFEKAALEAVEAMRFRPAVKDGRPVKSQKTLEVAFEPYGPRPGDPRP